MTLRPDELQLVRRIVVERSAIQLDAGKDYLIETRLETLARLEGLESAGALVEQLRARPDGDAARKIVEAMTTNETSFFRDRVPFDTLRTVVLPQLIASRATTRQLTIWCAASSTGQEPYSIAMTIREHFPELANWKVQIIATDLSTEVLDKARTGRYSQLEVNRGLPAELLLRHFEKDGARWRLRESVRSMVEFRELNLVGQWPLFPRLDVVFLRNVMIYFDIASRRLILGRVVAALARDGYLFLGAGETTLNIDPSFRRGDEGGGTCFRLDDAGSPSMAPARSTAELGYRDPAPSARPAPVFATTPRVGAGSIQPHHRGGTS